jgi:hypothetical protein
MITIEQATEKSGEFYRHRIFYHTYLKTADGVSPVRCRRNGVTKTWKRDKKRFEIPVKAGLKSFFYITQDNAQEWSVTPP